MSRNSKRKHKPPLPCSTHRRVESYFWSQLEAPEPWNENSWTHALEAIQDFHIVVGTIKETPILSDKDWCLMLLNIIEIYTALSFRSIGWEVLRAYLPK